MKYRLYIINQGDRDAVVTVLAKNGYTVRQGKEKKINKWIHFIEYWNEV